MIHRYWTGPDEPDVPGPVWHDADLPPELARWLAVREGQVRPEDVPRHRANMVRWWLLWHHGGLWLDHDAELHTDPPEGAWVAEYGGWACACAVQLPAGHPLAGAMLNHLQQVALSQRTSPQVSGARPLTRFARQLGVRLVPIPGPGEPGWLTHRWDTSTRRRAATGGTSAGPG